MMPRNTHRTHTPPHGSTRGARVASFVAPFVASLVDSSFPADLVACMRTSRTLQIGVVTGLATLMSACGGDSKTVDAERGQPSPNSASQANTPQNTPRTAGTVLRVANTTITSSIDASGIAEPLQQAMLSTKLMGTVTEVLVREGDRVSAGQALLRIDARDMAAKSAHVAAARADAEAMRAEASTHAARFTALYADSAATRAQYEAAMTGLARAEAGVRAARAAESEIDATRSYATVRAPFAGVVTARQADPGTFAAPGTPLLTVQDVSSLRITATVGADAVRALSRGQSLRGTIDGAPITARIEGIVPTAAGGVFTVNATVSNRALTYRAGSSAALIIPTGAQEALTVPRAALVYDGDLTGVIVRGDTRDERRWVRIGATVDSLVVVTSGLRAGEEIVIPSRTPLPKAGS